MKEIEKRIFIDFNELCVLKEKFGLNDVRPERQITKYYNIPNIDLRLMRTTHYSKLWMKSGKMHDICRDEKEVFIDSKFSDQIDGILSSLFDIKTKWYRERITTKYKAANICLDYSLNYSAIIEFEIMCDNINEIDKDYKLLDSYITELNLKPTNKESADSKYAEYISNWKNYEFPNDKEWLYNGDNL